MNIFKLYDQFIGDLNPIGICQDKGNLWENFLIAERLKHNAYNGSLAKGYFWRTVSQQEIYYVEWITQITPK